MMKAKCLVPWVLVLFCQLNLFHWNFGPGR